MRTTLEPLCTAAILQRFCARDLTEKRLLNGDPVYRNTLYIPMRQRRNLSVSLRDF